MCCWQNVLRGLQCIYIAVMGKWLLFLLITARFSCLKNLESKNFPLVKGIWKKSEFKEPLVFYYFKTPQRTTGFHEQMATTQASSFLNAYFEFFQKTVNRGYASGLGIWFLITMVIYLNARFDVILEGSVMNFMNHLDFWRGIWCSF